MAGSKASRGQLRPTRRPIGHNTASPDAGADEEEQCAEAPIRAGRNSQVYATWSDLFRTREIASFFTLILERISWMKYQRVLHQVPIENNGQ